MFATSINKTLRFVVLDVLNGSKHSLALWVYLLLVIGHFSEHVAQLYQVIILGWTSREAGGLLGLQFSGLAEAELLHTAYNSFQLTGLLVLAFGFEKSKIARRWWFVALIMQSWHWLEHVLLQVQYLTGYYLFNAEKQTSLLEWFFPRIELHFVYNLLVFIPTILAISIYSSATTKLWRTLKLKEN